jgi:hypothetical protein
MTKLPRHTLTGRVDPPADFAEARRAARRIQDAQVEAERQAAAMTLGLIWSFVGLLVSLAVLSWVEGWR